MAYQAEKLAYFHYHEGNEDKAEAYQIEVCGKSDKLEEGGKGSEEYHCHQNYGEQRRPVELMVGKDADGEKRAG